MIRKLDGGYVISAYSTWLPGFYESERAAQNAFKLPRNVLESLMDAANERAGGSGGAITEADVLSALRNQQAALQ